MKAQTWTVYLRGSLSGPRVAYVRKAHGRKMLVHEAPLAVQQYLNVDGATPGQPVLRDYHYSNREKDPRPDGLWGLPALDADLQDNPLYTHLPKPHNGIVRTLTFTVPAPPRPGPKPVTAQDLQVALGEFAEEGPGQFSRGVYRHTDCGPFVGLRLTVPVQACPKGWVYGDGLWSLGTWENMSERTKGEPCVDYLGVGSIVEGIDAEVPTIEVPCRPLRTLRRRFYRAVENVNTQAGELWNQTHGCEACGPEDPETGYRAINPACKACDGHGTVI